MVLGDNNNYMTQEYYVYPEFTQTIAYMEKKGVKLNEEIDTTNVEKIVINNFEGVEKSKELEMKGNYTLATGKEIEITSKEEIEAICNALLPSRFVDNFKGSYNIAQYLDITVYYKDAQNSVNSVVLNLDKIPDDLKRKIGY
jgi:hypothetical protein